MLGCLLLLLVIPVLACADVSYEGRTYPEDAEYIDLGDTVVTDFDGFCAFLDQLPNLRRVDMWENRMTADLCDPLAERYPDIQWGWTLVIKARDHEHLVRTDSTSFSTLHNRNSTKHKSEDFSILKYCWHLKALDVGHNYVTSLDFLYDLPELRVLIIAINYVEDITPLASLKDLEYAEIFNNKITDISPLKGLTHLLDLNISFNLIQDLSPLESLTTLKRLWMFSCQKRNSKEPTGPAMDAVRAALPNTQIDTKHYPTAGTWRYLDDKSTLLHPHYAAIIAMFGEDHLHPKYQYVPFEDSWPEEGDAASEEAPAAGADITPEPSPEPQPTLAPDTPQDFSDKGYLLPIDFTSTGSKPKESGYTGLSYSDSTISVDIHDGTVNTAKGTCTYWYADIRVTDASQLRTMAATRSGAFDSAGELDSLRLAGRTNAVLAINGDFWSSSEKKGLGYIIRQGTLYKNNLDTGGRYASRLMDVLLIDEDGDFIVLYQPEAGTIPATINGKRILNSFSFGPILVDNGNPVTDYNRADRWIEMKSTDYRQRMCICQVEPLHYMVLCCAGPYSGNTAMTLSEFAKLAASLGVRTAYNLDGGDSTLLYFHGNRVNKFGSTSQRKLMDIIYFSSGEQ